MNTRKFTPNLSKNITPEQKKSMSPAFGSSKFSPCNKQPSTDKAGNPICFKCGKIGFAQDCPKHPYKPRVFTLGVAEGSEIMEEIPDEVEETPDEQEESDNSDQEIVLESEED